MIGIIWFLIFISQTLSNPIQKEYTLVCEDDQDCLLRGEVIIFEDEIIEEDIIEDNEEAPRNAVIDEAKRWPNAEVPYVIHEDFLKPEASANKKKLLAAMESIEKETCIRFRPVRDKDTENYIALVPTAKGCRAKVGYLKSRKQTLVQYAKTCFSKRGTLQHELIHALGAKHEHARPDRDDWVTIVEANIKKEHMKNFIKAKASEFTTFGLKYNYESVMHYSAKAFSKNGQLTIVPKKSDVKTDKMGQRDNMTPLDIEMLKCLYDCNKRKCNS